MRGINAIQEAGKLGAGYGALELIELRPVGLRGKRAELCIAGSQARQKEKDYGKRCAHAGIFRCVRPRLL